MKSLLFLILLLLGLHSLPLSPSLETYQQQFTWTANQSLTCPGGVGCDSVTSEISSPDYSIDITSGNLEVLYLQLECNVQNKGPDSALFDMGVLFGPRPGEVGPPPRPHNAEGGTYRGAAFGEVNVSEYSLGWALDFGSGTIRSWGASLLPSVYNSYLRADGNSFTSSGKLHLKIIMWSGGSAKFELYVRSCSATVTIPADSVLMGETHKFGAYAIAPVQIDGQVGPGEWTMADSIQLRLDLGGVNYDVTLSVMNDLQNLYLLATVRGPPSFTGGSVVSYWFGDANSVYRTTGDDWLSMHRNWGFEDGFWNSATNNNPPDTDYGGTKDGAAAISFAGGAEIFELSHPLCSSDHAHDFCLRPGTISGFFMSLSMDSLVADWPGYDVFAMILVASSSGTVVTTQATSAGRTAIEPVPESSSSSRSIIWGVLIGLFVSAPISIYRHVNSKRKK